MAKAKRHAVTVLLTEDHLRKMIDDHLITEGDIRFRILHGRPTIADAQKLVQMISGDKAKPWHLFGNNPYSVH